MTKALVKKILIIEDDESILDVLSNKITEEGYKILRASDGRTGLELAISEQPDLILLDLLLPKINGHDLLKKLRKNKAGQQIPVIILTNDASSESMESTKDKAAPAYFIKAETNLSAVIDSIKYHLAHTI